MALKISENALKVLEKRYLKKDENGKVVETPEEMFRRVAKTIAAVDRSYNFDETEVKKTEEAFYRIMTEMEFMPNSPTLMNAGRPLGQLSACFVLPIEDSMESIFETLKATAIIHKSGGGTGFSFSRLREKNSLVQATGGIASGPISFMKVFDGATQAVKQGGTRRGANMGILRVDHPDVMEFVTCKEKDKEISNFNISIAITDDFWRALQKGEDYDLISPHTKKVIKRANSKEVFDLIVKSAHRNGEPGLIFIDKMNQCNPTTALGLYEATNPCGEQVLLPYESCNLGSINLLRMAVKSESGYTIDWDRLQAVTRAAVHFLDNVIDANNHPVKAIEKQTKLTRKIGLGVMGWSSLLCRLGIPYDTEEALELAGRVMSFILTEAKVKSLELAKQKGVFPAFEKSVFAKGGKKMRFRNATLTTIAPTGTISIIGGPCSSGIEPIFAICYYRNVMDKTKLVEIDPVFETVAQERGFYSDKLMRQIAEEGSIQHIAEVPDDVKRAFVTAHEITPEWHIKMQAEFQKYTDNAVSKTINFSHSASEEDVRKAYVLAYELNCKGITVYRDGSRDEQVLNITKKEDTQMPEKKDAETLKKDEALVAKAEAITQGQVACTPKCEEGIKQQPASAEINVNATGKIEPRPRPEVTHGTTSKVLTGCGNLYITINDDEDEKPFEVFMQMGKAGGCAASQLEAIGRLASLALRSGVDKKTIIEQLRGIRCPAPSWDKGTRIFSCADAISRVLEKRLAEKQAVVQRAPMAAVAITNELKPSEKHNVKANMVGVCPDCGSPLHHEEGCLKCYGCGFSKC
ncbi:MAG TPA: vitamin B12-dependent ribonucleotide reductase [Candidatus Omnitrophota bacterium]|nr:vitamin B12-dependent ribonucleotide reductase [Candidatus Omnitrophota bacterium]HPD84921.1 vitamin B12-dependent ribonucleotide reductase [Candidatus Omnitrophota bacterium]HRZ03779.1 vitamin B12-dependent ribonucleotide reductase [Candidatus Omnitrophota bacterium]